MIVATAKIQPGIECKFDTRASANVIPFNLQAIYTRPQKIVEITMRVRWLSDRDMVIIDSTSEVVVY